jgi:hypothetical protein
MDEESERVSPLWGRGRPGGRMSPAEMRDVQNTPEWLAAKGLITAAEYLMMFGDYRGPVELIEHESILVGPPKPRNLRR